MIFVFAVFAITLGCGYALGLWACGRRLFDTLDDSNAGLDPLARKNDQ